MTPSQIFNEQVPFIVSHCSHADDSDEPSLSQMLYHQFDDDDDDDNDDPYAKIAETIADLDDEAGELRRAAALEYAIDVYKSSESPFRISVDQMMTLAYRMEAFLAGDSTTSQ